MAGISRRDIAIAGALKPLTIFTVTGAQPGPTLATIGAIHGDEMEGPLAISSILHGIDPQRLSGTWIAVPMANGDAVAAYRRTTPTDGKNLARVFPGRHDGTPTEQLAAHIAELVIRPADLLIDLHSGGISTTCPTLIGYVDVPGGVGERARFFAEAFGAPVVWRHPVSNAKGRTLSVAEECGIPSIYTEAGGGTFPPEEVVAIYRRGVLKAMALLGMTKDEPETPAPELKVFGDGNTDQSMMAPASGICTAHVTPGQVVEAETLCFSISDLDGGRLAEVRAGSAGHIIFVRRNRWAEAGDHLATIATREE